MINTFKVPAAVLSFLLMLSVVLPALPARAGAEPLETVVTANNSAELAAYLSMNTVETINLVSGVVYDYEGGTISRALTINGNGAIIQAGAGVADTIVRSDDITVSSSALGNYASQQVFLRVQGQNSLLTLNDVTLKQGAYPLFTVINVKSGGALVADHLTLEGFHNNPTPGGNINFGIHAEPGAVSTVIRSSIFGKSNAFRNAIAIRSGQLEIADNTFEGTEYPQRLRQSDGYEYAIYLYGGNGSVTGNSIRGFDSTTQAGYASAGIAVIGFYSTNVTLQQNVLENNSNGIDVTLSWSPYSSNQTMVVNGLALTDSDSAYALGEAVKAANTQNTVAVSLNQNDEVLLANSANNNQLYFGVLGGYRWPYLSVSDITYNSAVLHFPGGSGNTDILTAATAIELQQQKDGETVWSTLPTSWSGIPTAVPLQLDPGHTYRFRSKLTHGSYVEPSDPTPRTLVTYSGPLTVTPLTYTIEPIGNKTATPLTVGYTAGSSQAVQAALVNTGTGELQQLQASLSGPSATHFILTSPSSSVGAGQSASLAVKAKDGLAAGAYTVTVTISAEHLEPVTFTVTQEVLLPVPPTTPQNVTAQFGDGKATVNWSAADRADSYKVYVSTTPGQFPAEPQTVVTTTQAQLAGLANGTAYYIKVVAVNLGGSSSDSTTVSVTPKTVPSAPTGVKAVAGNASATVSFTVPQSNGGADISGYEVTVSPGGQVVSGTASPIKVSNLANGTEYTFTVRAINAAGTGAASAPSFAVKPAAPYYPSAPVTSGLVQPDTTAPATSTSTGSGSSGSGTTSSVEVLVNGKVQNAGTATTSESSGRKVTMIAVDEEELQQRLDAEGKGAVLTIPRINSDSAVVVGVINGKLLHNMERQQATLELRTSEGSYLLPSEQLQLTEIAGQFGTNVGVEQLQVRLEIAKLTTTAEKQAHKVMADNELALIAEPVEFKVLVGDGSRDIELTDYSRYVERRIALPDGTDPSRITTGVVIEQDGTVRHVPTEVRQDAGTYYARINSLTNSTYAVIWNPLEFTDAAGHWAQEAMNDMGSRLVVNGTGDGQFSPDRSMTRAEFAAILVRGLGLRLEPAQGNFTDVSSTAWYARAVQTAYKHELVTGFEDGTFRPNATITREQAAVMISRAMEITGLAGLQDGQQAAQVLQSYGDAAEVSAWAAERLADNIEAGLLQGKSSTQLAPQATITRAEVATMIQRLLKQSKLI